MSKPWTLSLHTCESIDLIRDGDDWTLNGADAAPLLFEEASPALTAKAIHLACEEIATLTAKLEAAEKENVRLSHHEYATKEWLDKTEWVQKDEDGLFYGMFGKHRADCMKEVIEKQAAQIEALTQWQGLVFVAHPNIDLDIEATHER